MLWCNITQLGLLRFEGADAQSFLQGQLTNNVAALDDTRSQYAGYCTPKGRLLAAFLLWRHDGAYYMVVPRELCEPLRKRLSMYILRAKVKATDITSEHALFGVSDAGAADAMAALEVALPQTLHGVTHAPGVFVMKLPQDRYLIVAALSARSGIETQLTAVTPAASERLWSALDIAAGIPTIVAATQDQFVPQTVNFDLIGALSFDKGCYPGQEIVARTHYLGRVKQRMVRARFSAAPAPAPGDKLYSAAFGEQACGMIVSAVTAESGNHEVLAVVQVSIADQAIHWQSPNGPTLHIEPLPYASS